MEAENYSGQSGIQREASTEAGRNVGWIDNGDYLAFSAVNFNNGASSFTACVASAGIGGNSEIRTGNVNGALAGTCAVPITGGAGALFNINWFKNQNIYVIGGVPTYWRIGAPNSDAKPDFINAFRALNMISPWLAGRFDINDIENKRNEIFAADFAYTQQNNIVYQPVLWPGFAWSNMYPGRSPNEIPRVHGDFMWKQAYVMKNMGVNTVYVAMFDKYDEGTAIAKGAENSSMVPTNQYFLTLDADGVAVSADFYLRLTNDIGRMMKGEITTSMQHPTPHL